MGEAPLFSDNLLSSAAFLADLNSFLNLPVEVLHVISEVGCQAEGFSGYAQARTLNEKFGVPLDKAMRDLRIAEHIYNRISMLEMDLGHAINQLQSVASSSQPPVSIEDERERAIKSVLSPKRDYDLAVAKRAALANAPHFMDVNGQWSVSPVPARDGQIVKVPVITLGIVWHDGAGHSHEAFFQMSAEDWEEFYTKVSRLNEQRLDSDTLL